MNFDYSGDQRFLKEEARKFLSAKCPPAAARAILEDEVATHDVALWREVAAMGWLGIAIPEEYGGLGLGPVELCALAEEIGRAIAPLPFSSSIYLFAGALLIAGTEAQKARLLPEIVSGRALGTVAFTERPSGASDRVINATFVDGGLYGTKLPVPDGGAATHGVIAAREPAGPSLFIVDLAANGVASLPLHTIDPSRKACSLVLHNAPAERLGAPGQAIDLIEQIENRAAVPIAFEQIGGADRCLEMARDYALDRHAFGRPIGSYQAIKHKLADVYIACQLARSHAYYGAWSLGEGGRALRRAGAAARVSASQAHWLASKEMIEVFGGIGTTWEADCHLHYRRAKQLAVVLGGSEQWKEQLVAELEQDWESAFDGL